MSIDALKQELSALNPGEQRKMVAFLISIQDGQDAAYREKLARKIDDRDASHFASLDQLDARLGLDGANPK